MEKSLFTSVALVLVMLAFSGLVLFNTCQVHHLQEHIIESSRQVSDLNRAVSRMQNQLESGVVGMRAGGGSGSSDNYFARFFTEAQWSALNAPGNLLQVPTQRIRVEGHEDGGTLRRAFITDIPGLNPLTENSADVSELYHYISESLAAQQRNDPDRWIPGLAYRIEVNEDFTEYRVFLKEGVRWHRPAVDFTDPRYAWLDQEHFVTAHDFAFFVELVQNPQVEAAFLRNYYEDLTELEVVNDHEFVVRWSEPQFQSIAFTLGMSPMPRFLYAYDEDGVAFDEEVLGRRFNDHWFNSRAIGTGPYRFVRWRQGGRIMLERNDDYHGERPPVERLEFQVIADPTARLNNLRADDLDFIPLMPTQYRNEIMREGTRGFSTGELEHETFQAMGYRYIGWNADSPLFEDRRVRLAMTHALNRQQLVDVNMHGLGRVISGPFFIDGPDYNAEIEPWPYDLERAAELLTEAGWEDRDGDGVREKIIDGEVVKFEFGMLTYGHRPEFIAAMESFRNDLRRIGVRMDIESAEWAIMISRMQEKDFDAFTGGWSLGWFTDLYQIWHSSQADAPRGSNRVGFRNPEADEIIEEVRRTFDTDARRALFHRFHEIVHEEQPYTFWFADRSVAAWQSRVNNVGFTPLRPSDSSMDWYLDVP